jgi:hypothetical protein
MSPLLDRVCANEEGFGWFGAIQIVDNSPQRKVNAESHELQELLETYVRDLNRREPIA